jgi:beta-phosphoglucomutase-like phosphatase (HAD superfamily)
MLRALVWDVDGTLAETEHDGHRVAFNQAFAEEGLGWHWDEALYHDLLSTTGGKERMWRWWQQVDPAAAAAPEAPARIARLHGRKTAIYGDLVARGVVQLRPGVARLLLAARAEGLVLAIATTTAPENVQALLQATLGADSPGWFACIGAGDVVPRKKPAPDVYHWVLQGLGLPAGACLALEDSAPGSTAAVAAGLPTVVTRSRYTADDVLTASPLLRADLADLGAVSLAQLRAWHQR